MAMNEEFQKFGTPRSAGGKSGSLEMPGVKSSTHDFIQYISYDWHASTGLRQLCPIEMQ